MHTSIAALFRDAQGAARSEMLTLGEDLTFGRNTRSRIHLPDPAVARTALVLRALAHTRAYIWCGQGTGHVTVHRGSQELAAQLRFDETLLVGPDVYEVALHTPDRAVFAVTLDLTRPPLPRDVDPAPRPAWPFDRVLDPAPDREWQLVAVLADLATRAADHDATLRPRAALQLLVDCWCPHPVPGAVLTARLNQALAAFGWTAAAHEDRVLLAAAAVRAHRVLTPEAAALVTRELRTRARGSLSGHDLARLRLA